MGAELDLVVALAGARKATQLYPPQHPEHAGALEALVGAADRATQAGPFTLNVHQGRLYNQSAVLAEDTPGVHTIAEAFESRKIESMTLHPGFSAVDGTGLVEVLSLRPSPNLDVEAELESRGVTGVTIALLADDDDEREERDRIREQDRAHYRRLVAVLRTLSAQVAQGSDADLSNAENMVATIMGRLLEDQSAVLGLATMRGQNETDLFHSVNTMIYALALGAALGLPEEGLSSLGISALMHDVGKTAFDRGDLAQHEAMRMLHPKVGADILSRLPEEDPAPLLVAYEHHMHVDGGGYPERDADYVAHPFSRMVAIANRYANLTAPVTGEDSLTPDRALVQLLREAGSLHDPLFARLFAKAMGVFPVGCLVRLTDQSVGVVARTGDEVLKPVVRVVYDARGLGVEDPVDLDLAASDLSIVEVVHPESLDADVSEHL